MNDNGTTFHSDLRSLKRLIPLPPDVLCLVYFKVVFVSLVIFVRTFQHEKDATQSFLTMYNWATPLHWDEAHQQLKKQKQNCDDFL